MTPRHAAALSYAKAGIPVFPVRVGGKEPLPYSKGFKDATTDIEQINLWWSHADYNLAIEPEQAGWAVIDLDGQTGIDTWAALSTLSPPTRVISTPSGGRHIYYEGSLPPTAHKLGTKIDTRGRGSYVLVPPSVVNGIEYTVLADDDIALMPEWIAERVETHAERKTADGEFQLDSPERVAEARRRIALELRWNGEPQIGAGSDNRAYKLTARLREIGCSDDTITDMLEALWAPHFDREWIADKVECAEKYAQNERGSVHVRAPGETYRDLLQYVAGSLSPPASPAQDAETECDADISDPPASRPFAEPLSTIQHEPSEPIRWVWKDRLLRGKANLYTGDAGAGKTTLAEHLAVAVACQGVDRLLNANVEHMPVLLIVGEDDKSQVRDNLVQIAAGLDVLGDPGFERIFVRSVLTDDPEDGHLLARIREDEIEYLPFMHELAQFICDIGEPCLIVIDPLAEFVAFDSNNDASCRALGTGLCRLLTKFGAGGNTVLVNDHPSKASMQSGAHYAGSRQLKAAFALLATLLAGPWSGMLVRQKQLTLSLIKARYAAETETKFFRTSASPLFLLDGAPGETRQDHMQRVYEHIVRRLEVGEYTGRMENKGEHGRAEVAYALDMTPEDVRLAMSALIDGEFLVHKRGAGSGKTYVPAHFELGPKKPLPAAEHY